MILTVQNHTRTNGTAFRVYLVVSGICFGTQGTQMVYSVFLGMGKINLFGRVVTDINLGCCNVILAILSNAR